MKKILCVAICAISVIAAQAGSISGLNSGASVSSSVTGSLLDNSYMGQFYIGADANSLQPVGSPVNFLAAGLLNAGVITADGTVTLQLRAWKGAATYEGVIAAGAGEIGESAAITITATDAPAPPAGLAAAGLTSFQTADVPEPSTIALGLLGAAALFLRRRK
jgi:Zn-dependent alcohol dehydrogenase